MNSSESDEINHLLESLRTGEGPARLSALRKLVELPQISSEILAQLVELLKDPDPVLRLEAALVFRRDISAAIPLLVEALTGEDVELRRAAAATLGTIGPKAKAAVPTLRKALQDEAISPEAADALNKIAPQTSLARQIDQILGPAMPIVLVLAIVLFMVGIIFYVFRDAGQAVIDSAVGFCLIGGSFGGIVGGSRWGRRGAMLSALILGLGGALVGAGIGYVAGSIFGPLIAIDPSSPIQEKQLSLILGPAECLPSRGLPRANRNQLLNLH
jgi:hypothetical protein